MDYKTIIYKVDGYIATITLNRPDRLNAYNNEVLGELMDAIDQVRKDDEVRVLILTGAGRGFCAGGDISGFKDASKPHPALESLMDMREGYHQLALSLSRLDKPAIAAINGVAVGGGLNLALMCDFRIASDRARLGDGSLRFGFLPDDGGTYFLPRYLGIEKALEMILTAELVDAQEALRIGLVGRVVPHDELEKAALELARKLAEGPPIAQRLAKRALYKQLNMELPSSLEDLALAAQILSHTEDREEGRKAFREKRKPQYKGR